jgi:hypothetical protein
MYTFIFTVCAAFLFAASLYVGLNAEEPRLAAIFDPPEGIGHHSAPAAVGVVGHRR